MIIQWPGPCWSRKPCSVFFFWVCFSSELWSQSKKTGCLPFLFSGFFSP